MLKISYAGCLGLSTAILAQFTLEMRVAAQNCAKNSLKLLLGRFKVIKQCGVDWAKRSVV